MSGRGSLFRETTGQDAYCECRWRGDLWKTTREDVRTQWLESDGPQGTLKNQFRRKDRSNRAESLKTRRRIEGHVEMRNHQWRPPNGKASKFKRTALRTRRQAGKAKKTCTCMEGLGSQTHHGVKRPNSDLEIPANAKKGRWNQHDLHQPVRMRKPLKWNPMDSRLPPGPESLQIFDVTNPKKVGGSTSDPETQHPLAWTRAERSTPSTTLSNSFEG